MLRVRGQCCQKRKPMQRKCHGISTALLASLAWAGPAAARFDYVAGIDVQRGEITPEQATGPEPTKGIVFHDLSRDGVRQKDEPGVAGVFVTKGRDVTVTDAQGRYALSVFDNMTVMLQKPAWRAAVFLHPQARGHARAVALRWPRTDRAPARRDQLSNDPHRKLRSVLLPDDGLHPDLFEHRTGLCARQHRRRSCVARPLGSRPCRCTICRT